MILASIFIGPPGRGEDLELPPMVAENIESFKARHPKLPHYLFSGEDIEAFLEAKFPREVTEAYRSLKPYAYKADLARYCILYELGGAYADLAFHFVRPVPFDGKKPVVFRDLIASAPWDTSTSVFAAPEKHKALARAVDLVCANVRRRYYGPTPQSPTGPAVFGKALAMTCDPDELTLGVSSMLKRDRINAPAELALPDPVHSLMLHEGRAIIAMSRKPKPVRGLGGLGVEGSDDYSARWKNRDVYESIAATPVRVTE